MNLFLQLYPGDRLALLAINVLMQATVVILAAWLAAMLFFRRHAAVRHGLWLAALLLVLISPATALLIDAANVRIVAVSLPKFLTDEEEEETAEVVRMPSNNVGALNSALSTSEALAPIHESDRVSNEIRNDVAEARLPRDFASTVASPFADSSSTPDSAVVLENTTAKEPVPAPSKKMSTVARLRAIGGAIFGFWLVGVVYSLMRLFRGGLALRRLLNMAQPGDADERLRPIMAQIERHLGLKKMPPVLLWRDAKLQITPLTVGIFRPVVVLSKKLLKSLTPEEIREVLVHECAHVMRRDSAVGLLQRIALVLFWPYPLVLLLNRQLTVAREEVCDNYVLLHSSGPQYAQTLFDLSERIHPLTSSLAPVGLFQHHCPLEKRVAGLLDLRRNIMTRINRWAALCMAIVFLTISLAAASAKISKAEPKISGAPDRLSIGAVKPQEVSGIDPDASRAFGTPIDNLSGPPAKRSPTESEPMVWENLTTDNTAGTSSDESKTKQPIIIAGICIDQNEKPISNAEVCLYECKRGLSLALLKKINTDQNGGFAFANIRNKCDANALDVHIFTLIAKAKGKGKSYRGFDTIAKGDWANVEVKMYDAATIRGRVTDMNGKPIAGVNISDNHSSLMTQSLIRAITDDDGRYEIDDKSNFDLQSGGLGLVASHPEYVQKYAPYQTAPCTIDFVLKPASSIEGKVIDEVTGKLAVDVLVLARSPTREVPSVSTMTDSEGRYRLNSLDAGMYTICVIPSKDRVVHAIESFELAANENRMAPDLKLIEGGFIEGCIVDAGTGEFIHNDERNIPVIEANGPAYPPNLARAASLVKNGKFRFRVAPGKNFMTCSNLIAPWEVIKDDSFDKNGMKQVEVAEGQTVEIEFKVRRNASHHVAEITKPAVDSIQRRAVNKLVKDFPEKTDLSTPEAALASMGHICASKNIQGIDKLSWVDWSKQLGVPLKDIEDDLKNDPKVPQDFSKSILETEILQVLTYRDDLAEVITKGKDSLNPENGPYTAYFVGKINGAWKILTFIENASSNIEDFQNYFEKNKEQQWNLFQQVKKDVGDDKEGKSNVTLRALPPKEKKAAPTEQKKEVDKSAATGATLDQAQRDSRKWEVIRLKAVDPQSAVLSINKMFGISSDAKTAPAGVPKIDADITKRQLLVHGTEEQIAQIRELLLKMGESDKASDIQRREINKLVKDFPEKTDLSTPESALAAYHRATANKDAKTVLELSWRKYYARDIEEMERFYKRDSSKDMEIFLQALLDAEVIEVITYRNDFAQVVSKLKFPEGFGKDPYTSRSFGRINGQWKNLGEDRLPSIEAVRESFERKKDNLWKDFLEVRDIATGKKLDPKQSNEIKLPPEKYAEAKAATPESERLILMGLVENYFVHNARDITARKTLEWGEVKKTENGGRSIRYKFEARVWDKETMIADQIFTFDKDNVILGIKDANGPPVKKEPKKVDVNSKKGMQVLVEEFFANNFRDFTSRKTIEWGDVEKDAEGNSSIRYKYEATIWDKDIQIMNQIFTFDEKGEFVRFKNVEGFPQKVEDKAKESQSPPSNKLVNASPEEIDKRWSWLFGEPRLSTENLVPLKYAEACLKVAKAELEVSQEANRRVPGSVPMVNIKKLESERDSSALKVQYFQAALKGDEKASREIVRQFAKAKVDCLQSELDVSLEANRRVPGSVPTLMIEQMQLSIDLAKLDLETVEAKVRGDEKASQEIATRRAEIEAKLKPSPEEIHKRWDWLFGESKSISEKLLRENIEFDNAQIKKSQEANRKVPGTIPLISIQSQELARDILVLKLQYLQAAQKGDEKAVQEIARKYAKAIVADSQLELDIHKQTNQRQPGAFPDDWIQQMQLDFELVKLKQDSVEAQLRGDENASRELATRRAEVEAKRKAVEAKEGDDEKAGQ